VLQQRGEMEAALPTPGAVFFFLSQEPCSFPPIGIVQERDQDDRSGAVRRERVACVRKMVSRNMPTDTINKAEQIAEGQKQAGAGQIDEMAKAVHGAADELQDQMPKAAEFVHAAASRLEQGAGSLRERRIKDLVSGFNDFGRNEPLALFGGAMVAGFAISRFLKSSADERQRGG
jgi:hypothetical protein